MKFSDYCNPFYSTDRALCALKNKTHKNEIAQFFLTLALGPNAYILSYQPDTLTRFFSGAKPIPGELWETIRSGFRRDDFAYSLAQMLFEPALPGLCRSLGIPAEDCAAPDKYRLADALSQQFFSLAEQGGECANMVPSLYRLGIRPLDFPDYIRNAQKKYSRIKTLLYSAEERPFYDFFVCNTISTVIVPDENDPEYGSAVIRDADLTKLAARTPFALLTGMGGIGKSMMMRHLFLQSIRHTEESNRLPIFVTLREFSTENEAFPELIFRSAARFDASLDEAKVKRLLIGGNCQLLLDGLDEIRPGDMDSFLSQLDLFMDHYPANQIVMSSRRFSSFVSLSRFRVFYVQPFSLEQAVELIGKLKTDDSEEERKNRQAFIRKLEDGLFYRHYGFASNPLLLTLMLWHNRQFAGIPEKPYDFYHEAYETLLQRHDGSKLTMRRSFRSVDNPSEFTAVFREFCAKSYRKGDYSYDGQSFEKYFSLVNARKRFPPERMTAENFRHDALHNACLLYEEGQRYRFLHRSFQEFFFADYYSRQDDETLRKLGQYLSATKHNRCDTGDGLDMLFDQAQDKVERFIFLPYLDDIFSCGGDRAYWAFLKAGFSDFEYTLIDRENLGHPEIDEEFRERYSDGHYSMDSGSILFRKILNQIDFKGSRRGLTMDGKKMLYPDHARGWLVAFRFGGHLSALLLEDGDLDEEGSLADDPEFNSCMLRDASGEPLVIGTAYSITVDEILAEPEKYSYLYETFSSEDFTLRELFEATEAYYRSLKEKYACLSELEDENF